MKLIPIIIGSTCIISYLSYKYLKYNIKSYIENYIDITITKIIDDIDLYLTKQNNSIIKNISNNSLIP